MFNVAPSKNHSLLSQLEAMAGFLRVFCNPSSFFWMRSTALLNLELFMVFFLTVPVLGVGLLSPFTIAFRVPVCTLRGVTKGVKIPDVLLHLLLKARLRAEARRLLSELELSLIGLFTLLFMIGTACDGLDPSVKHGRAAAGLYFMCVNT
jgi:hypothetical protein